MVRYEPGNEYYTQFAEVGGVTIKANERVNPAAMQELAKIVALMLEGRQDITECISGWESEYAIFPKDAPVTDLPDFADLKGRSTGDGRPFDEVGRITGLGATKASPVSAISELSRLFPDPEYTFVGPWTAVHEFAHHLMNLCFSRDDYNVWERLHLEAVGADLGYGPSVMINVDEFFAELTEAYFSVSYIIPRRHLIYFPHGVFERLEEFYGTLTPVEAEDPDNVRHITNFGIPTPWTTAAGRTYEHDTFGYTIELLPGWRLEQEEVYDSVFSLGNDKAIQIEYGNLPDGADPADRLLRLAEKKRSEWERWTQDWDKAEVKTFEREASDGLDSYWIRFYGHSSPKYCEVDRILRILTASHDGRDYGVVLTGKACGKNARTWVNIQDIENIIRSFTP